MVPLLAQMLQEHVDNDMPICDYEIDYADDFTDICEKKYEKLGKPFSHVAKKDIPQGYWSVVDKKVCCLMDSRSGTDKHVLDLSQHDDVLIKDPFVASPEVILTTHGRKCSLMGIEQEFRDAGVMIPVVSREKWELPAYKERDVKKGSKRKSGAGADGAPGAAGGAVGGSSSASSGSAVAELNSAMGERLKQRRASGEHAASPSGKSTASSPTH